MMSITAITATIIIVTYLIGVIYSTIVLYAPYFKTHRIQPVEMHPIVFLHRLPLIALNLALVAASMILTVHFFGAQFSTQWPGFLILAAQIGIILIFDDTYFYFYHLFMHKNKFLYKHVHAVHHHASAPIPLENLYTHPLETTTAVFGILLGFTAVYLLFGSLNIYTFWGYFILGNLHALDVHSGIKSVLLKWIPLYGSAEFHDAHHAHLKGNYAHLKGNYALLFSIWDRLLGTTIPPHKPEEHSLTPQPQDLNKPQDPV